MSEIIAEAILPAETLQQYVDTFTPLVDEGCVHFNDGGIHTTIADPANIAMIAPAELDSAAFESYDAPGAATIGVNFVTLDERLSKAGAGELVHLAVDMETRKLTLEYGNATHAVGMIDPDAIRNEPDGPDLELPNQATLVAEDVRDALDHVEMVSDHVEIAADPDAEAVTFVGAGDIDDTTVTFDADDILWADVQAETMSLFSHDYLDELTSPMPADAEVTLTFGDEFPMLLDWEACEGHLSVHQIIAPRIQSD